MAFRFRREGDFVKHRKKMSNSGMTPWVHDFKHRVMAFHYDGYMREQARRTILEDQSNCATTQTWYNQQKNVPEKLNTWRTFVPNITPFRANSNPFCPISSNTTGWKDVPIRRLSDSQPMSGHAIAGTDDSVPIFPKYRG